MIGGSRSTNSDDKALFARYETNGLLDSSFGSNGHVFANVGDGSADDLAVSGSGKLLAVGPWSQSNTALGFFLIRRQANGHPDLSFGNSGIVKPRGTYDGSPAVAIQPDGRIVVAEATNGNGAPKDVFVARFLAS